ncbi:FadR/GntR family transcriptional regulator [Candidatus Enterococcus murrayae]|uniref:FadR family transcriptional regulator n=1 Tax=Candidatus Enterococcus murrayae TaxID=2815321 RepID=A0ABS3HE10_9ENTE|nr:GntR family transcriptional regulator [Enterococcus sp. MJM16]MBO0451448.1 FadR family transcriptional regulator [Enterococcus sp. MJM16]
MEKQKKMTQSEKIMNQIADRIVSGELKPGEKLPNERSLSLQLGVTRGQVREALRALSLVGLVVIKPSDGTFVSDAEQPVPENSLSWIFQRELHDQEELYHARKLIETDVVKLAFTHATKENLEKLESITQKMVDAASENKTVAEYNELLEEFDSFMGRICGSRIMEKLMQTIILIRRESALNILEVPGAIENSIHYRQKIERAFVERDRKKLTYSLNEFYSKSKQYVDKMTKEK